ncbi:hypothetical protein Scep_000655 [Stephania cephalantha]|uniref:Uncharacterized protein n=1 Tax=Stephania cephalantha TaxID=152367 RepID=A0AAP0LAM2_9MAGN
MGVVFRLPQLEPASRRLKFTDLMSCVPLGYTALQSINGGGRGWWDALESSHCLGGARGSAGSIRRSPGCPGPSQPKSTIQQGEGSTDRRYHLRIQEQETWSVPTDLVQNMSQNINKYTLQIHLQQMANTFGIPRPAKRGYSIDNSQDNQDVFPFNKWRNMETKYSPTHLIEDIQGNVYKQDLA